MNRHRTMVRAAAAGTAATAGLIIAAAIVGPTATGPQPTPTGYRPPLSCDYAVTSSQCPQLSIPPGRSTTAPSRTAPTPARTVSRMARPTRTR